MQHYTEITSASNLTTPRELINKHNIIVVSVNYRLGPFGWLAVDDLNKNSDFKLDKSYNFGTLDLIKALEWVNKNIELFGGDEGSHQAGEVRDRQPEIHGCGRHFQCGLVPNPHPHRG